MLVDDGLLVSECPGLGKPISLRDAQALGADLCRRQAAEAAEEAGLRIVYERSTVSPGTRAVIDSEGMKVVHD